MKKLMIGFAAAGLCAAVFADVTSANVVGYAQSDLRVGNIMLAPQFTAVGGADINLTSIVPVGGATIYGTSASQIDSHGRPTVTYLYTDCGGESEEEIGWADPYTNEMITDETIKAGTGLWLSANSATDALQSAGEVSKKDVDVELISGNIASGNPYPTKVAVQDILLTGANPYGVSFMTLDSHGRPIASYLYTDCGGESEEEIGWVDPYTNLLTEDDLNPGDGIWISGTANDEVMTFPAPKLN